MYAKRTFLALFFGLIAGLICGWTGYSDTPEEIRMMVFITVVLNRLFIGFIIGISAWKMKWQAHGIVLGLLGTLPLSVPLLYSAGAGLNIFLMYTIAGVVWGFLIELLVSKALKAPQR